MYEEFLAKVSILGKQHIRIHSKVYLHLLLYYIYNVVFNTCSVFRIYICFKQPVMSLIHSLNILLTIMQDINLILEKIHLKFNFSANS